MRSEVPSLEARLALQSHSASQSRPARVGPARVGVPSPQGQDHCPKAYILPGVTRAILWLAALGILQMESLGAEGLSGLELCLVSTFPSVEWAGHFIP